MACARIPLAMGTDDTPNIPGFLATDPLYLGLYNEPDLVGGSTPTVGGDVIGQNVKQVLANDRGRTQYLSPALFNNQQEENIKWWSDFNSTCPGCIDQIPIISMHLYESDVNNAYSFIKDMHDRFSPDHKLWLTELSPRDPHCTLDDAGVKNWMQTLLPKLNQLPYLEKVFWNNGEFGAMSPCQVSLTNGDGTATTLLEAYGADDLCAEVATADPGTTS